MVQRDDQSQRPNLRSEDRYAITLPILNDVGERISVCIRELKEAEIELCDYGPRAFLSQNNLALSEGFPFRLLAAILSAKPLVKDWAADVKRLRYSPTPLERPRPVRDIHALTHLELAFLLAESACLRIWKRGNAESLDQILQHYSESATEPTDFESVLTVVHEKCEWFFCHDLQPSYSQWSDALWCMSDQFIPKQIQANVEEEVVILGGRLAKIQAADDPDADGDYSSRLVGNKIRDPSAPLTAAQIAIAIWGEDDKSTNAEQREKARKRALDWMKTGKLPANLADGPEHNYVVSVSTLERLAKIEGGVLKS